MNKQGQPFKQAVKIFYEAHALSDTQLDSLQQIRSGKASESPQLRLASWRWISSIAAVPEQYKVEMSKFCRLDQYQMSHLRVAGVEQ